MSGTLFGVGVGPGDPDLLTLKAARVLGQAPVIVYPAPEEGDSLARRIAAPHIPAGRTEIALRMSFDPAQPRPDDVYDQGAKVIARYLDQGQDVAVLCEGDPFFFGSFVYLFARLSGSHKVEVIPGVSSVAMCAAALGAPVSAGNDLVAVIPAPRPEAEIEKMLLQADAAAIMKLGRHLPKVRRVLQKLGLAANARYIEWAGTPQQTIRLLHEAEALGAPYFSMILVHRRGQAWC